MNDIELAEYWDNKHPKQNIIYSGRSIPILCTTCKQHNLTQNIQIDVRSLVSGNDSLLKQIIIDNNLKGSSCDDTILRIQKWVCKNLKYVGDEQNQGALEFWQMPFETIASKIGDCEDGAILIASLALNADVPTFRIRITAGLVKPHEITAPAGGHGYLTYLRESDNVFVPIDWCFFPDDSIEVKNKKPIKDNPLYKEIWFSFNNLNAWGNTSFNISSRLAKKD